MCTYETGEQLNIPGLQSRGSRQCVRCGRAADLYCSACGVTPYCGGECQKRDWRQRHKDVCHNLARLTTVVDNNLTDMQVAAPLVPPLRRPRSPPPHSSKTENTRRDDDAGPSDRARFHPPDHKPENQSKQRNFKPRPGYANNLRRPNTDGGRPRADQENRDDEDWDNKKDEKKDLQKASPTHMPKKQRSPKEAQNKPKEPAKSRPEPAIAEAVKMNPEAVNTTPETVKTTPEAVKPSPVAEVKPPVSIADVTPVKKRPVLVPKSYLIETLSVGDLVLLSVDAPASECRTSSSGYVCLSMNAKYESDYQMLCEDYVVDCEADTVEYSVTPGETFSYFNPEDSGWYRARCLTPTSAALLDGSKVVQLTANDKCKRLTDKYSSAPEFCCVLDAKNVEIGQSLSCTIVSKTKDGYTLSMEDVTSGAPLGTGGVTRWLPEVEYAQPKPTTSQAPVIPEVPRPPVRHGATMLLVEASAADRVLLRPADAESQRRFDSIVQDVAIYGNTATSLKEPPVKGSTVIAKFVDGLHYRAMVRRTNVKQNKYMLEYIEFGNTEIVPLENLFPCPQEMTITTVPTEVSVVTVPLKHALTAKAQEYLENMKDQELIVMLPNAAPTAPSGSEATLTVAKNKECVNVKLADMCKPEWLKIEEKGGDVVEIKSMMYSDLAYLELPSAGCTVEVLDYSMLQVGQGDVAVCPKGSQHRDYVNTTLNQRITDYCNSNIGREPYLPKIEELCIAKDAETGTWHRAVLLAQESGAGGSMARVYYIDRGNTELLSVSSIRKILPEFVDGLPALALELEILGYPPEASPKVVSRALAFLKSSNYELRVKNCAKREPGMYTVDVPELIAAIDVDQ